MTIEDELKSLLLTRYKSLREFCLTIDLPYSTVTSILKRGIPNANVSNIIKICNHFNISADGLANGKFIPITKLYEKDTHITEQEFQIIEKYRCLPPEGKATVDAVLNVQYDIVKPQVIDKKII